MERIDVLQSNGEEGAHVANRLTLQLLIRCYIHHVCRCDEAKARLLMSAIKREAVRMRFSGKGYTAAKDTLAGSDERTGA